MPTEQNWRPETGMFDYLSHQNKATQVADRRPVIRKASDLVGPGIGASATVVTDWSNVLATFNGYFSSSRALNAPFPDGDDGGYDSHRYVGFVVTDETYGGKQIITDLDTGIDYSRIFRRAPADPGTIVWGPWVGSNAPDPSAYVDGWVNTPVPQGVETFLNAPEIAGSNIAGVYDPVGTSFSLLTKGVYTGVIHVKSTTGPTVVDLKVSFPKGLSSETREFYAVDLTPFAGSPFSVPFTFVNMLDTADISISAYKPAAGTSNIQWSGMDITRTSGVV